MYLPSLFKVTEGDFKWKDLNKSFERNFEKYKIENEKGKKLQIRRNLYSTISGSLNRNKNDIAFLFYLDNLFNKISERLDFNEKKQIKKNLRDLLSFKGFLEYLGELSVLNSLLETNAYKLLETESENGKKGKGYEKRKGIDFKLYKIETKENVFVEVINIELKDKYVSSNEAINKLLSEKLIDKIRDKNKSGLDYLLIPVLWYEKIDSLKRIVEFYEEGNFKIEHVEIPRALVLATDEAFQSFEIQFGSIYTVIKSKILS